MIYWQSWEYGHHTSANLEDASRPDHETSGFTIGVSERRKTVICIFVYIHIQICRYVYIYICMHVCAYMYIQL